MTRTVNSGIALIYLVLATIFVAGSVFGILAYAGYIFPKPFSVSIESSPSGALLTLDGKSIGLTPITLSDVAPGEHVFTFSLDGHRQTVVKKSFAEAASVKATLEPLPSGIVAVSTEPDGARVFLDGIGRGHTPTDITTTPGRHFVSIVLENFDEFLTEIEVSNGNVTEVKAKLTPSTETYYKKLIAAEPEDLANYSDLVRYYYIKKRYDDMASLIIQGCEAYYSNKANDEGRRRFEQEIKKVKADDMTLFNTKIQPILMERLLEAMKNDAKRGGDMLRFILGDDRRPEEALRACMKLLKEKPELNQVRLFIAQQSSILNTMLPRLTPAEVAILGDMLLESDKYITDKKELYTVYKGCTSPFINYRDYARGVAFARKALANVAAAEPPANVHSLRMQLYRALRELKLYKEAMAEIDILLSDSTLSASFRTVIKRERDAIEAKAAGGL